ncbi:MAG: hypothetical protein IKY82_01060 [Alistipes sp.]|nr:hypothetical protein [Alistipes sp.]
MKRVVLMFLFLSLSAVAVAQTNEQTNAQTNERTVRRIECEIGIGWWPTMSWELRYNFNEFWDTGLRASMDLYGWQMSATGDYNHTFKNGPMFFCGLGLGVANVDILDDRDLPDPCLAEDQMCFYAVPRVGFEFFRHLRLSLLLNTYNFQACVPTISLGVAIGGGRKK